ncbi:MAG: LLM class F420-dependent oxidoreductase [Chloroflexota bacterium]
MKIGIHLGNNGASANAASIAALAARAEELGYDSVWVSDHVAIPTSITSTYPYGPPGSFNPEATKNFWEPFSVLAFVAGMTKQIELGTSVIVLPQRPPLLIAKQWATLDALSGGRAILGVGAGWMREEFEALGFGHQFDRRGVATDESIKILRAAWTTDGPVEHHGEAYDFGPVLLEPKPARPGGLPIWIGGHGKRSIRRAAELGDGWQPLRISADELSPMIGYLHEQCQRYGRHADDVTLSLGILAQPPGTADSGNEWELTGDPDACADRLHAYQQLGVKHIMLSCARGASTDTMLAAFEFVAREVRPRLEAR